MLIDVIILGVDPGTAATGYGIIKKTKKGLKCLEYGCIETSPKKSHALRLKELEEKLKKIIKKHNPDIAAVEDIFFFKNLKTAMKVSQAKGVILLALAKANIPIFEYTPLQVKMGVCGYGKADKQQVQRMIQVLLNLKTIPRPDDAADALATAVCYLNSLGSRN